MFLKTFDLFCWKLITTLISGGVPQNVPQRNLVPREHQQDLQGRHLQQLLCQFPDLGLPWPGWFLRPNLWLRDDIQRNRSFNICHWCSGEEQNNYLKETYSLKYRNLSSFMEEVHTLEKQAASSCFRLQCWSINCHCAESVSAGGHTLNQSAPLHVLLAERHFLTCSHTLAFYFTVRFLFLPHFCIVI